MTVEEELRRELKEKDALLDELITYFRSNDMGENIDQDELDSINNSIGEYKIIIEKLIDKVNNDEYYKRTAVDLEFDLGTQGNSFVEVLQNERENMLIANKRYHKRQSELTKLSAKYYEKTKELKNEKEDISRILDRDELAKENNIVKKSFLSEEEISGLRKEIEYRELLLQSFSYLVDYCAGEIRRYGKLITVCEEHLMEIDDLIAVVKQIISLEIQYPQKDTYRYLLDQKELRKAENACKALENRKKEITYNPIKAIEEVRKTKTDDEKQNLEDLVSTNSPAQLEEKTVSEKEMEKAIEELIYSFKKQQEESESKIHTETEVMAQEQSEENIKTKEDDQADNTNEKLDNKDKNERISTVEPESTSLFIKKEINDIFDSPQHLKQEKTSDVFKEKWDTWVKKEQNKNLEKPKQEEYNNIPEVENEQENEEQLHEVILTSAGDYVGVPLPNGEMGYVDYGDSIESAPEGVSIRYEGSKMYITYPERRKTDSRRR